MIARIHSPLRNLRAIRYIAPREGTIANSAPVSSLLTEMPLYLVATPIGNLEDITLRALRILREADIIACEDTRHTGRLLVHYGISGKKLVSYHEHNERQRAQELLSYLLEGKTIAIVTDAGSPGIADPAYRIVTAAVDKGIAVVPVPGASALIAALTCSGAPTDSFFFGGFLPARAQARRARLLSVKNIQSTLLFYETPHRIKEALRDVIEILGNRKAVIAREITKLHEEFLRGSLEELEEASSRASLRGEMTLVIEGAGKDNLEELPSGSIAEQIESLIESQSLTKTDALKAAARSRGISRKKAYELLLEERKSDEDEGEEKEQG